MRQRILWDDINGLGFLSHNISGRGWTCIIMSISIDIPNWSPVLVQEWEYRLEIRRSFLISNSFMSEVRIAYDLLLPGHWDQAVRYRLRDTMIRQEISG